MSKSPTNWKFRTTASELSCDEIYWRRKMMYSRRVLYDLAFNGSLALHFKACPHDNTDNLHEIIVMNFLVSLNKEGVARVQHPANILFMQLYFDKMVR